MVLLLRRGRQISFFAEHSTIFKNCIDVINCINNDLRNHKIASDANCFDLLLPFLIEEIQAADAKNIAYNLRIHQEIADYYNKGGNGITEFRNLLIKKKSLIPVSFTDYQQINKECRRFVNRNLVDSYIISTKRVYYRFKLLKSLPIIQSKKIEIIKKVKIFSVFLLFDDDVYDLENDLSSGKNTILIQFLKQGFHLVDGVNQMVKLIQSGSTLFEKFTSCYRRIYTI